MTEDEVRAVEPGLYRVFWRDGTRSVAAVGGPSGSLKWISPVDWCQTHTDAKVTWSLVDHIERIIPNQERVATTPESTPPPKWAPWATCRSYPNGPIPISGPPCSSCAFWNPEKGPAPDHHLVTVVRCCTSKHWFNDFSCYRGRPVPEPVKYCRSCLRPTTTAPLPTCLVNGHEVSLKTAVEVTP